MAGDGADRIAEVLTALELTSQLYFRAELGRPFAIAVPAEAAGVIRFHVVAEGSCAIALPGPAAGAPVELGPGDLVLVPHGCAHTLADEAASLGDARPLPSVLEASGFDRDGPLVAGGPDPGAVLVCGHFAFGAPGPLGAAALHPILASLPALLTVRARAGEGYSWLAQILRHVESEARARRAGYREVVRRLSEIFLIEALRAHAATGEGAALSALADPQLGRALHAIHARPEADWTLASLAREAGQSRTLFAQRFRERMGASPMKYLAAWRMQTARRLLARGGCSVSEVARRVGYASESAFHRSFRAQFGEPPGLARRAAAAERASA